MKKNIMAIYLAVLMLVAGISAGTQNIYAADSVTVIVDGLTVNFPDAPAYIDENGRTQLPARYIGEALGAHVAWDETLRKVTVSRFSQLWEKRVADGTFIDFYIDSALYYTRIGRDGKNSNHEMDTIAVIKQNRTYVPVRYIAEALGAEVEWDSLTRTVAITSETKTVGEFVVPKSFTENVRSLANGTTSFGFPIGYPTVGHTSHENKLPKVMHIISQRLGEDTIKSIMTFISGNMEFDPSGADFKTFEQVFGKSTITAYGNVIFDSKTRQYVDVIRVERAFIINIHQEGYNPNHE